MCVEHIQLHIATYRTWNKRKIMHLALPQRRILQAKLRFIEFAHRGFDQHPSEPHMLAWWWPNNTFFLHTWHTFCRDRRNTKQPAPNRTTSLPRQMYTNVCCKWNFTHCARHLVSISINTDWWLVASSLDLVDFRALTPNSGFCFVCIQLFLSFCFFFCARKPHG